MKKSNSSHRTENTLIENPPIPGTEENLLNEQSETNSAPSSQLAYTETYISPLSAVYQSPTQHSVNNDSNKSQLNQQNKNATNNSTNQSPKKRFSRCFFLVLHVICHQLFSFKNIQFVGRAAFNLICTINRNA